MLNSKKAIISFEELMWIPRIIFLIIAVLSIVVLANQFVITSINVQKAESEVFKNSLIYAMSYVDEGRRMHIGTIDAEKLDSAVLEESLALSEKRAVAAKITIDGKEVFFNQEWYDRWSQLTAGGAGGVKEFTDSRQVMIKDGDSLKRGELKLSILMPNS